MWNEPTGPEILPWAKNCGTCSSSTSEHVTLRMDSLKNSHVEQVNWSRKSLLGQKSSSQVPQPTTCSWGTWSWQLLELHPSDSSMESNTCHFYLLH